MVRGALTGIAMAELTGPWMLAVTAAVGLLAFGILLLRLARWSGPAFVLGIFAVLWGAQVLFVRGAEAIGPTSEARVLLLASEACVVPLPLLLLHFAASFPTRLRVVQRRWWLPAASAPSLVALAALALDPRSGVTPAGPTHWGWALSLLLFLPFLASLVLAMGRFARGCFRESDAAARRRLALPAMALLAYTGYLCGEQLFILNTFAADLQRQLTPAGHTLRLLAASVGLTSVAGLGGWAAARAPREDRWAFTLAVVLPVLAALLANGLLRASLTGFWRLVMVGLLWYAVARYQLFDLDLRLRSTLRPVLTGFTGFAVAGAVAALGWNAAGVGVPGALVLGPALLAGASVAGVAHSPLQRWFDRAFPQLRATEEYLLRRKLEVYRAALDSGVEEPRRAELARELKLKPWEQRVLERGHAGTPGEQAAAPGRVLADRYAIESELARGVYGRLFLAWDRRVGERVVLKEFAGLAGAGAGDAFAREAKLLGQLEHRNIIAVRDVFRAGEDLFLAMEHAPDGSLEQRLEAGALPEPEALDIARQVLAGLAAAHKEGIVHRDVKPANVLFKGRDAKLADFGVAFDPVLDGALRAAQGQPGTIAWMAPEQALGQGASAASDVYASGALLYRMLAGHHYILLGWLGEQAARRAVATRAPSLPLPGVSEGVNAVLAKALAKDPKERYPDAGAMLRELQRAARRRRASEAWPLRAPGSASPA